MLVYKYWVLCTVYCTDILSWSRLILVHTPKFTTPLCQWCEGTIAPLISKRPVISLNQIPGIVCTTSTTNKKGEGHRGVFVYKPLLVANSFRLLRTRTTSGLKLVFHLDPSVSQKPHGSPSTPIQWPRLIDRHHDRHVRPSGSRRRFILIHGYGTIVS